MVSRQWSKVKAKNKRIQTLAFQTKKTTLTTRVLSFYLDYPIIEKVIGGRFSFLSKGKSKKISENSRGVFPLG